ncbi:MAG: ribonuclease H-like domain-containing protein [Candidatus Nanoarchaeia archaeon]
MLQNTFIHIPAVSRAAEINIWNQKIHTWQDFIDKQNSVVMNENKKARIVSDLQDSMDALKKKNYDYFSSLPSNQHWRLYDTLKDNACFLDIETTGLSKHYNDITLIGIHSLRGTKIFMKGENLDKFENELKKYSMIVTFNGRCFDVPFLRAKFPAVEINQFHADLRFIMADLGFRGGLKNVERERGIAREEELKEVDGFEAVRLWHKYQRGDNESLVTLKKYLTADVRNLVPLMNMASAEMKKKHFLDVIRN